MNIAGKNYSLHDARLKILTLEEYSSIEKDEGTLYVVKDTAQQTVAIYLGTIAL